MTVKSEIRTSDLDHLELDCGDRMAGSVGELRIWGLLHSRLFAAIPLLILAVLQFATFTFSEPVFYGDENRHVMTSIFFRDMLADRPLSDLRGYAENYYVQYPALGLLIWPPLFHALTGIVMLVAGTSHLVGTLMVGAFGVLACVYVFRLVARTHDAAAASVAMLLFGLCPIVFEYSRHVMLEVPTLAWGLMAIFHFERFLEEARRRDVLIAAFASACAALTRFDAVYLLPLFGILLAARGQWRLLKRGDVWFAAAMALVLVLPYYVLVASEVGELHARQASKSVMPTDVGFLAVRNFLFYPSQIPRQVGWFVTAAAILGVFALRSGEARRRNVPYLAMLLATYITFTPLAEMDSRHSIYWVPAIVVTAIEGVTWLIGSGLLPVISMMRAKVLIAATDPRRRFAVRSVLALILLTATTTLTKRPMWIRGYEAAAQYVLENSRESKFCLFDGWLDGNFTYYVRHLDPQRRFSVLRGDKLFYGFICVPGTDYTEYATTDREMLDVIDQHAPEFLVVEEPTILQRIPAAERLRVLLRAHPEQFRREKVIPVSSGKFVGNFELQIYRNLIRHPDPNRPVEFEVLGLNKSVRSTAQSSHRKNGDR